MSADTIEPVAPVEEWAIVAQMGHVTFCGRISEEERFGGKIGRCDVPQPDGTFLTRYFTAASLYALTPCTEELARRKNNCAPEPVTPLSLPAALDDDRTCERCGVECGTRARGLCASCRDDDAFDSFP